MARRLFLVAVLAPITAVSVGVDGGDIFQMVAVETLALDTRAVGTALLAGALSIPVQVWAARISLARARHNLRWFVWLMGAMALATSAVIVAAPPGSWIAGLVLVIAVAAEIAVSVLFATSWQPLISYAVTVDQRQFILGRGRALAGLAVLGGVVVVGQLGPTGRAVFVAALGLVALGVGRSLRILPSPPPAPSPPEPADRPDSSPGQPGDPPARSVNEVFVVLAAVALASWPLLVSYAAVVLWPGGNLGLLGGALALGGVAGSALWRDPGVRLIPVIRASAAVVGAMSMVVAALGAPIGSGVGAVTLLGTVTIGSGARSVLRTAVVELTHRRVDVTTSVRVMTLLDVVGSTSFQVGAFAAGFLITASVESGWPVDPYRLWLVVTAAVLVVATSRLSRLAPSGR